MRKLVWAVILVACGHPPSATERWFADRGRTSPTWHSCTQIGASLRAACGGATACEASVTNDITHRCYAARYAAATDNVHPDSKLSPEMLSPCFWDRGDPRPSSAPAFATKTCETIVNAPLRSTCVAEIRAVIEGACTSGSPELTGAGP